MSGREYQDFLDRLQQVAERSGVERKRLDEEHFELLHTEYERLLRRMDPADIQLDEWKRLEELRFLLIVSGDEDDL